MEATIKFEEGKYYLVRSIRDDVEYVYHVSKRRENYIVVAGVYSSKHGKACRSRIHAVYPDFDGPVETFKTPAGSTVRADKEVEKPF